MRLDEAAKLLKAKLLIKSASAHGHSVGELTFFNITTDTRQLQRGDLFVALQGERFDGHDFLDTARERGAVAAIVEREIPLALTQLIVPNTIEALGKLGQFKREHFAGDVVAITGSCGKTTTRQLLANILAGCGKTLSSIKSFNNNIGVPLTLWQLTPEHRYAVLEAGANHRGEIAYLTNLICPRVAVIVNAAAAHLEGFGNMQNIAAAKGEIFQGLPPSGGIVILNGDDHYYDYWCDLAGAGQHKIITFSVKHQGSPAKHKSAYITLRDLQINEQSGYPEFTLVMPRDETVQIKLPLLGEHNAYNALAAAAAAFALDVPLAQIKAGLEGSKAVDKRLVIRHGYGGAKIIDDSYNALPPAVEAALHVLAREHGTKILVLGDMLELGAEAIKWHEHIGKVARELAIDKVYTYGENAKIVARVFQSGADAAVAAQGKVGMAFNSKAELVAALKPLLCEDVVVLVKGSRSMGMGEVVDALV
jgi:UDP-N-acetylmuramoyl-tripeptide--D-alanyl-D-alanine ligase